ncbi:hypothetical protein BS50DRAFT_681014 [Corynespora cassiicola Philippines]|uniref:FAD dependent oxidoreductase domain-containing protein n=1 Tax=Corynespora cassiicola Philippines TaxID=1448308 RepID=A0A2T2N6W1_CORCC|nr:hypothetical protein BS50DRAFT_681014 [Corynespora cassiicola Philippines]
MYAADYLMRIARDTVEQAMLATGLHQEPYNIQQSVYSQAPLSPIFKMSKPLKHLLLLTSLLPPSTPQSTPFDPGLPAPNPSISYWQTPPLAGISDLQSSTLPSAVDIVIIGSGMTGTSIASHLLKSSGAGAAAAAAAAAAVPPLRIAMLDAREACSGATGRNGGHIRPSSYAEYANAKEVVSREEAEKITRLRSAHVQALIEAAGELGEEGRVAAEARVVDSVDAFFEEEGWRVAVGQLEVLRREVPDLGAEFGVFEGEEGRNLSMLWEATGIITGSPKVAGAIWPYRFVTHTLKDLLEKYPSFSLDTNTPALNVSLVDAENSTFEVTTPRGKIRTRHVVHAANAWIPHLVPGLGGIIGGGRLHMSAQLGGTDIPSAGKWPSYTGNGSLPTGRAWSLYRNGLDYVVQMPRNGEFMFGGGETTGMSSDDPRANATQATMDDSLPPNHITASYLNGALPNYFGYENWGAERSDFPQQEGQDVFPGRAKRVWTGIEGQSTDGRPLVGRIPTSVTQRPVRNASLGAEWISTAYAGEGMCFAWLCGQALGSMILAGELTGNHSLPDWFPLSLQVTEERMKRARTSPARMEKRLATRMSAPLRKRG